MKKALPLFLALLATASLDAQITVTNATFPALGDTLRYAIDFNPTVTTIDPPGGNKTWDWSQLQADAQQQVIYHSASEGTVGASVPLASLVTDPGGSLERYYSVNANKFEQVAQYGTVPGTPGIQALMALSPPRTERRAPLNFFDINQQTMDITTPMSKDAFPPGYFQNASLVPDSVRVRININQLEVVDAWGTLTIPNGSFEVLREKSTVYQTLAVDIYTFLGWVDISVLSGDIPIADSVGTDTTTQYRYYSNEAKEPIAVQQVGNDGATVTQAAYKSIGLVNAVNEHISLQPSAIATPNPASETVRFELKNFPPGEYSLQLIGANGAIAFSKKIAGQEQVDLSTVVVGHYFYRIVDDDGKVQAAGSLQKK